MFSAATKTAAQAGGYRISRSLRFNSPDNTYLTRTPSVAGNRKTWTWSAWVKRSELGTRQQIFNARPGSSEVIEFTGSNDTIAMFAYTGGVDYQLITTQVFRDSSAWYHIVWTKDTTQSTDTNRMKLYVNGVQVTAFGTATYPTQNSESYINNTVDHYIGCTVPTALHFGGYMAEMYLIDGQALTPSSFGETNAQTGVWQPKAYSGSYGTNGFYLNFSDNSNTTAATLGKDYSGNGNNWTPNNFSVAAGAGNDSLVDTPTPYGSDSGAGGEVRGNYCTLNPLDTGTVTLANGNLDVTFGTSARGTRATFGVSTGKYYFEMTVGAFGSNGPAVGVAYANANITTNYAGSDANAWVYNGGDGKIYNNGIATGSNATYTTNDVIGVAINMDSGTVTFYKNNSAQPSTVTGLSGTVFPVVTCGGTAGVQYFNFGQRPFAYTAPSGFKALCTQNLPTPTIGATTATQAGNYFVPTAYTGNGSSSRAITNGINMAANGGLVWTKQRSGVEWHFLIDNVRGNTKYLSSNATNAEGTISTLVTGFDSTGYSIGNDSGINSNGSTYVSWVWGAGGSGVTNTAGSITSTVSANTTSGFSIVTYTGNGANATIGHGLGVAPKLVIQKYRTAATNWFVYHASLGTDKYVLLNTTDSAFTNTGTWQNTAPTSSVFSVGAGINDNGYQMVAYCFAEVPGYSRFGSYVGNGSADGPFVFCGFRPAYLLIKSSTNPGSAWGIYDVARSTFNVVGNILQAQASDAEITGISGMDILSNGFKLRDTNSSRNTSGETYIYAAFASTPFKYSIAR